MKYLLLFPVVILIALVSFSTSEKLIFETIKWANDKYLSEYEINLDNVDFNWKNNSLTKKNIRLKSDTLCFKYVNYKNCFQDFIVDIKINLLSPMDFDLKEVKIESKQLNFKIVKSELAEEESSQIIDIGHYLNLVKNSLDSILIDKININLPEVIFHEASGKSSATLILDNNEAEKNLTGRAAIKTKDLDLKTKLDINLGNSPSITTHPVIILNKIIFELKTKFIFHKQEFEASIEIIKADIDSDYKIASGKCNTRFPYEDEIKLTCNEIGFSANLERKFFFKLSANTFINNDIDLEKDFDFLTSKIEGFAEQESAYQLGIESKIALSGSANGVKPKLLTLEISANISKFTKLVHELAKTSFAIPAPFNNLKGSGKLTAKLDAGLNFYKFPLTGSFILDKDRYTQLKLAIDANLELNKKFEPTKLSGKVLLKSLKFYIPDIDPLFGIPELSGTDRINKDIKFTEKKKSNLKFDLQIKTQSINSIRIYNQFFDPYLSLSLKAKISNEVSSFDIKVKDGSHVQYLKRKLEIKKISIDKTKFSTLIDANFEYQASGYQVFLKIIGTMDKPRLILSSFPSLPRDEIISLLLYNRRSSELSGFDRASVGSTEDAISNRALGLFSIWAFASTPVDSVSYNAQTKTYNAVVSLPGGTSVSIGTDWDRLNNLSFRKRLSATWAVVTTLEPTDTDSKETIMLQKEINF